MMNTKLTKFIKTSKGFMTKHSPEILTGIGIAGMLTTTVLAVKATPKALYLIEDKKEELEVDNLTAIETIKAAWKPYIPAAALCVASVSCLIGASTVNYKRNAALATAYAISEKTLVRYRDKVIETIGEKKEKDIREKVAQDEVNKNPVSNSQVIITSKGDTLCKDSISGRYFESDIETIKKVVNKLNKQMIYQQYVSLDEFYSELGLEPIKNASYLGWNLDDGLIEVEFSACLAEDDKPCLYVDYTVAPRYEFDKLM